MQTLSHLRTERARKRYLIAAEKAASMTSSLTNGKQKTNNSVILISVFTARALLNEIPQVSLHAASENGLQFP
jgi:hypothetical protein